MKVTDSEVQPPKLTVDGASLLDAVRARVTAEHDVVAAQRRARFASCRERLQPVYDSIAGALTERVLVEKGQPGNERRLAVEWDDDVFNGPCVVVWGRSRYTTQSRSQWARVVMDREDATKFSVYRGGESYVRPEVFTSWIEAVTSIFERIVRSPDVVDLTNETSRRKKRAKKDRSAT